MFTNRTISLIFTQKHKKRGPKAPSNALFLLFVVVLFLDAIALAKHPQFQLQRPDVLEWLGESRHKKESRSR